MSPPTAAAVLHYIAMVNIFKRTTVHEESTGSTYMYEQNQIEWRTEMIFASTLGTMKQKMFCVGSNLLMCSSQLIAACNNNSHPVCLPINPLQGTASTTGHCSGLQGTHFRALQGTTSTGQCVCRALQDTHCRALQEGIKAEGLLQMRGHRVWGEVGGSTN